MSNRTVFLLVAVLLAASFLLGGCTKEMQSVYNPNYDAGTTPVITSVASSTTSGLASVTVLTLTGTGFGPSIGDNIVYFDGSLGQILSASPTQLVVRTPYLVKDSIAVRVAVYKVDHMSNTIYYSLAAPALDFGNVSAGTEPWACAVDANRSLYVSFKNDSVYKFSSDGKTKTGYSVPLGGNRYTSLKWGNGGTVLYGARLLQVVYTIPPKPGPAAVFANLGAGVKAQDIDFDPQGNIWVCGNNLNVYRVTPAKAVKAFPSPGYLRTVRVYVSGGQQYIYFGGFVVPDSAEMVIRYPYYPTGDSLGAREVVFNYTTSPLYTAGRCIYGITLASTGELFVGTDGLDPMIIVPPGGTAQTFDPGILSPTIHLFAWGTGPTLYAIQGTASGGNVTASTNIKAVNTLLTSAPYYGLP